MTEDAGLDDIASQESAIEAPTDTPDMHGDWDWTCNDGCWDNWSHQFDACDARNRSAPDEFDTTICEDNAQATLNHCITGCDILTGGGRL